MPAIVPASRTSPEERRTVNDLRGTVNRAPGGAVKRRQVTGCRIQSCIPTFRPAPLHEVLRKDCGAATGVARLREDLRGSRAPARVMRSRPMRVDGLLV